MASLTVSSEVSLAVLASAGGNGSGVFPVQMIKGGETKCCEKGTTVRNDHMYELQ